MDRKLTKMNITEDFHPELKKNIPASQLSDIACFVFYDHHPKGDKNIDITICTKSGELREYLQRDLQSSLNLNCVIKKPCELRILRSINSELFYLLASNDELFIISSKDSLQIHERFSDIDRYDIEDMSCNGETTLRVIRKDDAVPIILNSKFESLVDDHDICMRSENVVKELKRKLVEARYATTCNERIYALSLKWHQDISLKCSRGQQPLSHSSVFKDELVENGGALKLKSKKPSIKVCNKKLLIMFNVMSHYNLPRNTIHVLLHSQNIPSLVYTTKVFTKLPSSPHWHAPTTSILKKDQEIIIAAVIDLNEIVQNVSRVELNCSIAYKLLNDGDGVECLVAFHDVMVSSVEIIGDEIDVLSSGCLDDQTILAILATTEKTELRFRHIKNDKDQNVSLLNLFCTHLQMDRVENASNVIVYRKSPYHALNGTMLVFHESDADNGVMVSVHTRTLAQVLVVLYHIYDSIPAKIIATTPSYRITAKTQEHSQYNEEIIPTTTEINYKEYAKSMQNRSGKILNYLNDSMQKMYESKIASVQSKVGSHIDLFAGGVEMFNKFRDDLMNEAKKGVESLMESEVTQEEAEISIGITSLSL